MSVSVNDIGFALYNLYSYNDKAWIWMSFLGSLYLKIQLKKKKLKILSSKLFFPLRSIMLFKLILNQLLTRHNLSTADPCSLLSSQ